MYTIFKPWFGVWCQIFLFQIARSIFSHSASELEKNKIHIQILLFILKYTFPVNPGSYCGLKWRWLCLGYINVKMPGLWLVGGFWTQFWWVGMSSIVVLSLLPSCLTVKYFKNKILVLDQEKHFNLLRSQINLFSLCGWFDLGKLTVEHWWLLNSQCHFRVCPTWFFTKLLFICVCIRIIFFSR